MKRTLITMCLLIACGMAGATTNAGSENESPENITATTVKKIYPIPATKPNKYQEQQIKRKYGMFIHFGINTFQDQEWTDGSKPAKDYAPKTIDAEQWARAAKEAGMKYVILTVKHHDGFCLWDSKYTEYDVASSSNTTNVVEAIAKACKKQGIGLGIYYSLWDRSFDGNNYNKEGNAGSLYKLNPEADKRYNDYMIRQLNEIMDITERYVRIVEFWFDGGWLKECFRWPVDEIYQTIKSREPQCQIGINWSIGLPDNPDFHAAQPEEQKEGYPIRYFPSDFRLGDPKLPADPDPKLFMHDGKMYYMPWESTVCISQRWFYNTQDTIRIELDKLITLYRRATAQDNILIINCPPNRDGQLRAKDIELLKELKNHIK